MSAQGVTGSGNSPGGGVPPSSGGVSPSGGGVPPSGGGVPPSGGGGPPPGGGVPSPGGGVPPSGGGVPSRDGVPLSGGGSPASGSGVQGGVDGRGSGGQLQAGSGVQGVSGGGAPFLQPDQVAAGAGGQEEFFVVKEATAGGEAGLFPGSELVLPSEVTAFIREKLIPSAQYDVSAVLVRRGIAAPELFKVMGDCSELVGDLRDPTNVFALRAVAAVYSPHAKPSGAVEDSGAEELLESLRVGFESDFGVRVPSRYLVSAKVFSKLRKNEHVREDECIYAPAVGLLKRKMRYNPASGEVEVDEGLAGSPHTSFPAASIMLNISRWLLSQCVLKKLKPVDGMLYLMRLLDACQSADVHTLRDLDADLRLEAMSRPSLLASQLVSENGDIVARHRESGRAVAAAGQKQVGRMAPSHGSRSSRVCRQFERSGRCSYGDACIFAHSGSDSGPREDQFRRRQRGGGKGQSSESQQGAQRR